MAIVDLYPLDRVRHMPFFYYPTVNTDTDSATPEVVRSFDAALARSGESRKAILYVHVPFCRTHCSFCFYNVNVVKKDERATRAYLDAILAEMRRLNGARYLEKLSIEHVFVGGGTPSMLPDAHLRELLCGLREHFDLSRVQDFSIEMNVETMTETNLAICRELGVTRVSFGWQTSIPRLRKFLALVPNEETLAQVCDILRSLGYPVIWDLMFALPGQTAEDWALDLQRSIDSGVACVDIHRTDLVPPAPLHELVRAGKLALPTSAEAFAQYRQAHRAFTQAGYVVNTFQQFNRPDVPSAISHYGRYYYRSSHDIVAIGPGAIGLLADHAYMNLRDIGRYVAEAARRLPIGCVCPVDDETWQERDFVLGMGQLWSVPKSLLRGPLSAQQEAALDKLVRHGAIQETAQDFRLTEAAVGYHFSIANEFVTRRQLGRNVGYLRSMPKEIAWSPARKRLAAEDSSARR
jgi:coproporphyrinogen III oxidase-like Fe-S oxidoreductase